MKHPPELITSTSNPLVKSLKSLERKKERAETGLFLAEGARIVSEGLARGWHPETVVIAADMANRPQIAELGQAAARAGARVVHAPERLMTKITQKENAQSVVAAFRQRHLGLSDLPSPRGKALYIALYEVRDPGNLGTILRTADCAGLSGVILLGTCCDPYSFEAVRASMGSLFDVPFAQADFAAFNSWRRLVGHQLVAASVNGTVRHDGADFTRPSIILMGNEQAGLPAEVEAACDQLTIIPMRGGADSLNLAQASAVMIYEAWRQRGYA